jgi:hypothetical protein
MYIGFPGVWDPIDLIVYVCIGIRLNLFLDFSQYVLVFTFFRPGPLPAELWNVDEVCVYTGEV